MHITSESASSGSNMKCNALHQVQRRFFKIIFAHTIKQETRPHAGRLKKKYCLFEMRFDLWFLIRFDPVVSLRKLYQTVIYEDNFSQFIIDLFFGNKPYVMLLISMTHPFEKSFCRILTTLCLLLEVFSTTFKDSLFWNKNAKFAAKFFLIFSNAHRFGKQNDKYCTVCRKIINLWCGYIHNASEF